MTTEYNINDQFTFYHRAKLLDPEGKGIFGEIIDVMDKIGVKNFVRLWPTKQANMGLHHELTRTTSTPAPTRRTPYHGVTKTGADFQRISEHCIYFEGRSEIDELEFAGCENDAAKKEVRRAWDQPHITGMLDQFVTSIFNDAKTSGGLYIQGLKSRMATLSSPSTGTGNLPYCYDNGGAYANGLMSCYLLELGFDGVYGIYPRGEFAEGAELGIDMDTNPFGTSNGKNELAGIDSGFYRGYVTLFRMWHGCCVANDWKIARIANIEKAKDSAKGLDEDILIEALNHGKFNRTKTIIIGNPWLQTQLDIRSKNKLFAMENKMVFGQPMKAFQGDIPIVTIDSTILTVTEAAVTT